MTYHNIGWASLGKNKQAAKIKEFIFGLTTLAILYMATLRALYEALNR